MTEDARLTADDATPLVCSLFSVQDHHPDLPRGIDAFYRETLEQCVLAEELGYRGFWLAEHHFHVYGVVPNPAVWLAAAAARTRRIRLGPAISVLPFRDPVSVAEDYAVLDQLSGGRVVMGVGSGYLVHEFAGFGIDGKEKRERFDEAIEILRRMWSGERVSFTGRFSTVRDVALNVLPVQVPHPPLYVAALRAEACYHVGRQGNLLLTIPYASVEDSTAIAAMVADYRRGWAESGRDGDGEIVVGLHCHVAASDGQARSNAAAAFDRYVATRLYARSQTYDDILRSRLGLFGGVDTVVDQLVDLHSMGVRHVMLLMNFGALADDRVRESMRLFADAVMPRVVRRVAAERAA